MDAAAAGEEIVIARAGKPVARPVALVAAPPKPRRVLRQLARQFRLSDDFDAPLPEDILDAFEGR